MLQSRLDTYEIPGKCCAEPHRMLTAVHAVDLWGEEAQVDSCVLQRDPTSDKSTVRSWAHEVTMELYPNQGGISTR